ncbi:c-type cytochrome [Fibrella aquatica]|jgi:mono/diheme cytochrome c family protein|uniref:c-type cytochrome n=1 Tax=Fibrella aquatica TaxID=3242487 RepID=UPI00352085AB
MLDSAQLRTMLMVLFGLAATVALMFVIMILLAWHMPGEGQPVAQAGQMAGGGGAPVAAAKVLSADALAGKEIFAGNCASCHSAGADKLLGPGLAGIRQRAPGEAWLQKWIRNSSAVIASGDAYAVKIFNDNGKIQMTSFTSLTDLQIKQVLDYVDSEN